MGRAFEYRKASKEKRWDKMSKLFPKLAKAITIAAKEGGPDPLSNAKLRSAILNAKANNLPKDNIESAIKRASKENIDLVNVVYEAKAPHGIMMIIECTTSNPNRTIANLKSYCNRHNSQIIPNGSLEFIFQRKSVFEIEEQEDLDSITFRLIDYGLEDAIKENNKIYLYASYENFGNVSNGLKELGLESKYASLQFIPNTKIKLEDEKIEEIYNLIDKIEDDDDVQNVYTNLENGG